MLNGQPTATQCPLEKKSEDFHTSRRHTKGRESVSDGLTSNLMPFDVNRSQRAIVLVQVALFGRLCSCTRRATPTSCATD